MVLKIYLYLVMFSFIKNLYGHKSWVRGNQIAMIEYEENYIAKAMSMVANFEKIVHVDHTMG